MDWIKNNKFLLLIVCAGIFLRLYKLDFQSMWVDELFSVMQSDPNKTYSDIYTYIKNSDPHPPLYYFSLHFFFGLVGQSAYTARLLSVIYGIAGILAIYGLGKELLNKKTGLIAAALLAVNFFHIEYSQEARMYTLLCFTTTLSFYGLTRFIKAASFKTALIYAASAALMIYSQFFGLFVLFAQYVILLWFVIKPYQIKRSRFFGLCFLAGVVTLLLYTPALFILAETTKIDMSWIPLHGVGFVSLMFMSFFGKSVLLIALIVAAILLYLFYGVVLHRAKPQLEGGIHPTDPIRQKSIFSFFFLSTWALVTFLIPLILSYLDKPMLIERYMICILPALLLLAAAGIACLDKKAMLAVTLSAILILSLTNLFVTTGYYQTVTKEQFREVTSEIIKRNPEKSKIVMALSWLLPFYFKESQTELVYHTLEEYVAGLKNGSNDYKAFWYVDGHSRPFALNQQDQDFLAQHFLLKEKLAYLDTWANYYVPIGGAAKTPLDVEAQNIASGLLGIRSFTPFKLDNAGRILLFENTLLTSNTINLEQGQYELEVKGQSYPEVPIDNQNAHLVIKANDKKIADFTMSEKADAPKKKFIFRSEEQATIFTISYDNDMNKEGADRNVLISDIALRKIK